MTRKPTPRPERPAPTTPRRDTQEGAERLPDADSGTAAERSVPEKAGTEKAGTGAAAERGPRAGDRIAKVLSRAGVASRRDAEKMIAEGRVAVNGKVIDSPALNITGGARITVDGRPIAAAEPARLWLYHKPTGLVTTTKDEQGRETIFDALPEDMPRVLSVGRLDLNSEGLLLLTNDGGIKRQLELPSTGWLRRYRVRVKGDPTEDMLEPLREGIVVDREEFQPMIVSIDRQQGANAWLTVALREGKNREIRRAMENVGLVVNRLIRVSYGPFQLGTLKVGAVEEVKRRVMRDQLGLEPEEEDTTPAPRKRLVRKSKPAGVGSDITEETFAGRSRPGAKPAGKSGPRTGGGTGSRPMGATRGAGGGRGAPTEKPTGKPSGKPTGKPAGKSFGARAGGLGKGSSGKGEERPSGNRSSDSRSAGSGRTFSSGGGEAKPGGARRFGAASPSGGARPTAANPGFSKPSGARSGGKPSEAKPGGGKPGGGGKPAGRGPGGPKGSSRGKPRDRG